MAKQSKTIATVREPKAGAHDLAAVNALEAEGWVVEQMVSDCQSAIVYVLVKETE